MNNDEFEIIAGSLEANLGAFILKDKHKRNAWFEAIGHLPFNRCQEAIEALVEKAMEYKTSRAPSVADFKRVYYKKFPREEKQMVTTMDKNLDCCDHGLRYVIMAGRYPDQKPLTLKKAATRYDEAGTVYEAYSLQTVPCSCVNGQNINGLYKNFDYEFAILQRFAPNSFGKKRLAHEWYDEHIQPISKVTLR